MWMPEALPRAPTKSESLGWEPGFWHSAGDSYAHQKTQGKTAEASTASEYSVQSFASWLYLGA